MLSYLNLTLIAVFLWGVERIYRGSKKRTGASYPPGPKPKPLIGNALDIPVENSSQVYAQWEKKYKSKILHAEALGQHVVILNSIDDVDELLERRAKIYSDRADIPLIKLMGWEFNVSIMRYNDEWRLHRKICQQQFRSEATMEYVPLQVRKLNDMLYEMLQDPQEFDTHIQKLSISIPLSAMYGYDLKTIHDPCVIASEKSSSTGNKLLMPGGNLVNVFPILGHVPAWVPGAVAVKTAAKVKAYTEEMKRIPTEHIKKRMEEGTASRSLMTEMLERKFSVGVSEKEEAAIENIAYTVYGAASETTTTSLLSFFYLMAKHRDIQRKAQEEIERLTGSKRIPNYDDRLSGSLPYVEAIYRELMRIAAPLPLSVPHAATEDDYYKGYFIPKGTTVIPNIWAMTHDETRYPDPFTFKPERFLDENGAINGDSRILAYGFGRRACVGKYIASSTMWLSIVSILACFDIGPPKDAEGHDMDINDDYEEKGLVRRKIHLPYSINVRSSDIEQLIISARAVDGG